MQEKCFSRGQLIPIRNACYGEVSGFLGKEAVQALYAIVQIQGILLKVPKRFHEKLEPILGKNFEMKPLTIHETASEEIIDIVLTKNKQRGSI